MAARTAIAVGIFLDRGNDDAPGSAVTNYAVASLKRCTLLISNNGLDWVGGTDTVTIDLSAAISGLVRNGKTVTVRGLPLVTQAMRTDNAGAATAYAAFLSLSTNTLTITPKSDGYLTGSTNATVTGTHRLDAPLGVTIAYTEA